jgi:hypothetical protein
MVSSQKLLLELNGSLWLVAEQARKNCWRYMKAGLPQEFKCASQVQQAHLSSFSKHPDSADNGQAPPLRLAVHR